MFIRRVPRKQTTRPPKTLQELGLTISEGGEVVSSEDGKPNIEMEDNVVVIVPNHGVRPGVWSFNALAKESLHVGSAIGYIQELTKLGYGVLVTNPNENTVDENNNTITQYSDSIKYTKNIPGNETPEIHMSYIWKNVIPNLTCEKLVFLSHSYGTVCTVDLLVDDCMYCLQQAPVPSTFMNLNIAHRTLCLHISKLVDESFTSKVCGIAMIESIHSTIGMEEHACAWLKSRCKNWVSSNEEQGAVLGHNVTGLRKAKAPITHMDNLYQSGLLMSQQHPVSTIVDTDMRDRTPHYAQSQVISYIEELFQSDPSPASQIEIERHQQEAFMQEMHHDLVDEKDPEAAGLTGVKLFVPGQDRLSLDSDDMEGWE
ncbi:hypothetical protein H4219_002201 [Mycoemilia scoparia]|uniref:Arb2 domain-containing protein n=1 Tax=Mycoemilia scoparia TaxID=417184 RepID=A0A9W8A4L4_9FUNG|nr:hypothetical protein H4219_002201 [Mycoemilia scoparia]